jgi:hypothetical protein
VAGLGKITLTKNCAIVTGFANGPSFALQSFTRISAGEHHTSTGARLF